MVTRSTWRSRLTVLTTLVALLLPASSVPAAVADDAITHQDYADTFRFAELREKGYTGKGVTIAYIEAAPDLTVPELQGTNVEVRSPCEVKPSDPSEAQHSSTVASILANKNWGIAPEAKIINYTITDKDDASYGESLESCNGDTPDPEEQIHRALNDGADVINLSFGIEDELPPWPFVRAALLGVPIVASTGNDGTADPPESVARYNTVVGVGATNLQGTRSEFSSYGKQLTIMAPGEGISIRSLDENDKPTVIKESGEGTSFSAPIVAGLLALGKQKYPDATGNQLLRSLIDTATRQGEERTDEYGWGLINFSKFLNNDPTSLEDTNPLWDKIPGAAPDEQVAADYRDGLVEPDQVIHDDTYVYRGVDDTIVRTYPDNSEFGTSPRYRQ